MLSQSSVTLNVIQGVEIPPMAGVAADDFQVGRQRAHFRMGVLRHWGDTSNLERTVGKHRERGGADRLGIGLAVAGRCRISAASFIDGKQKTEVQTGFSNKRILCFLEATRLPSTAASPRGRHVQHMIFSVEIPEVRHFATLVDEGNIVHHIAHARTIGLKRSRIVMLPSARVTLF